MIRLTQHIPSFVDTDGSRKTADVETPEDLERVEWIRSWRDDKQHTFHRWSWSSDYPGGRGHLMAEYDKGDYFWVIAYGDTPIPGLPEWEETETARLRREKWNRTSQEEDLPSQEEHRRQCSEYWYGKLSPGDLFLTERYPDSVFIVERATVERIDFHSLVTGPVWATPEEFAELAPYCPLAVVEAGERDAS